MIAFTRLTLAPALLLPSTAMAQESRAVPPQEHPASDEPMADSQDGDRVLSDDEMSARERALTVAPPKVRKASVGALGRTVPNDVGVAQGHVLVDIGARRLYYGIDPLHVRVYPVAVGKSGAQWRGTVVVGRKAVSPGWHPTANQRRKRHLPVYVAPGRSNPLGTHAIYLFRGGRDTLLRIHGTNEPRSIGHAVSSGCIRMRNADVSDLYGRVSRGTIVTAR